MSGCGGAARCAVADPFLDADARGMQPWSGRATEGPATQRRFEMTTTTVTHIPWPADYLPPGGYASDVWQPPPFATIIGDPASLYVCSADAQDPETIWPAYHLGGIEDLGGGEQARAVGAAGDEDGLVRQQRRRVEGAGRQ